MSEEDILRLIDNYEVEVEGKVSQAAFAYPPMSKVGSIYSNPETGRQYIFNGSEWIRHSPDAADAVAWPTQYEMVPIAREYEYGPAYDKLLNKEYEHQLRKMLLSDMQIKMDQQFINLGPTFT